jgi:hypothetical protein
MIQTKGPRGDHRRPPSPPTGVDLDSLVPLEVMLSSRRGRPSFVPGGQLAVSMEVMGHYSLLLSSIRLPSPVSFHPISLPGDGNGRRVRSSRWGGSLDAGSDADASTEEAMGDERIGDNHPDIPPQPPTPNPRLYYFGSARSSIVGNATRR